MKQCKLFEFIDQYRSDRPFISHQNKYEQIDDLNKQYIRAISNFNNQKEKFNKTTNQSLEYSQIKNKINLHNPQIITDMNMLQEKYNLNFEQTLNIYKIIKDNIIASILK